VRAETYWQIKKVFRFFKKYIWYILATIPFSAIASSSRGGAILLAKNAIDKGVVQKDINFNAQDCADSDWNLPRSWSIKGYINIFSSNCYPEHDKRYKTRNNKKITQCSIKQTKTLIFCDFKGISRM